MRFLADMGISQSTVNWLRQRGYDAIHLQEEGLHAISDKDIVQKGERENRTVLTCDLDFGYLMAISSGIRPSIVVFRLEDERPENVNKRLAQVLDESSDALERGAIIVVEEASHRVRSLPISETNAM
jgi:predicted nuclease of predicted toxin-antitoxin system